VGLVPSEHSSGQSRAQGSITKTGNGHARRLLVEAAWHHRARYRIGKTMRDRWSLAPAAARILTAMWSSMWRVPRVRRTTLSRRPRRDVGHGLAFTAFDEPDPALVQSVVALVSAA
jgi:transposase